MCDQRDGCQQLWPDDGLGRRNRAPSVRQKRTVSVSSRPVSRMQGSAIPCALIWRNRSVPFMPGIPMSESGIEWSRTSGLARNSSPVENRRASYPAELRRSPSAFKTRRSSSTTTTVAFADPGLRRLEGRYKTFCASRGSKPRRTCREIEVQHGDGTNRYCFLRSSLFILFRAISHNPSA